MLGAEATVIKMGKQQKNKILTIMGFKFQWGCKLESLRRQTEQILVTKRGG